LRYRHLGSSGLLVSEIGLGANPFGNEVDAAGARAIVHRALDLGVTYIDTADIYNDGRSEECVGQAIKSHRHDVVLGSKATGAMGRGPNDRGASRAHLLDALDASLRRLGTDYLDLYQMHNPDPRTPIEETVRALDDMVRSGKVRYVGVSNYTDDQLTEAIWTIRADGLTHSFPCNRSTACWSGVASAP
jgi:aryl-alcohol dehydrogenase-like predicted oxidoreductase